jgi:ubiquinone/menaquinone biosynthesis C-methylase UbiE
MKLLMTDKLNRKHWYDGWIYAKLIDSAQIPFRYKILDYLDKNDSVLDVGCGTGGFTLEIANRCKHVVGIDVSKKQIEQAKNRLKDSDKTNIEFMHVNALELSSEFTTKFEVALFTFMLHEISHEERLLILNEVKKVAKSFIVFEYNIPHPYNFWGIGSRIIEFLAGRNHFNNFIDFGKRGGINRILIESGFKVKEEKINRKNIFKIVVVN